MEYFYVGLACFLVGFGIGYGFRGWIYRRLRSGAEAVKKAADKL